MSPKEEIEQLRQLINYHNDLYTFRSQELRA